MKCATWHQPWGTLVVVGQKAAETRGRPPAGEMAPKGVRGQPGKRLVRGERLGIHVAASVPSIVHRLLEHDAGFRAAVFLTLADFKPLNVNLGLPAAKILGSCRVMDAVPVEEVRFVLAEAMPRGRRWIRTPTGVAVHDGEHTFGDYRPGRWVWLLDDIAPTLERCPACWGTGQFCRCALTLGVGGMHLPGCEIPACLTCEGNGRCPPIPATGRQGVWTWEPLVPF